ncbi:MAG: hypothetical protein GX493_08920 [Firmicutes bacterium]|nr:hypothetical protein [Bacillota bacterium]
MSNDVEMAKRVARLLRLIAAKIEEHPEFLADMELVLKDVPAAGRKKKTADAPVAFDVFQVFLAEGEGALRQRLESLELKALKGIISRHGFDPSNLAQRWRKKEKLIDLIVERVTARSEKGRVFRT